MVRQNYNVNANEKKIEVFDSFGGGMVTQPHPERLRNHESVLMENVDILAGGVVTNRGAYNRTFSNNGAIIGNTQGRFVYVGLDGTQTDIVAINGKLYKIVDGVYSVISITGLLTGFQTTRKIEAAQLRDKMYFATGNGIVEYNGTTATKLTAYAPTALEALYIGTNGLASDPDNYMTDATGAANVLLGVTVSLRYGVINKPITFTAYVEKVVSDTLEYKFEYKFTEAIEYTLGQDFGLSKTWVKSFDQRAEYMVRVTIRKQGTTTALSQYVVPRYKVNSTPEENPEPPVAGSNLNTCTKIFVHYDRLWIYGDPSNPDFLYISHLNKFTYFPRTNIIKCTDPLRGALNRVVRYKDFLVCFTDGSLQMISGTNPKDFIKTPIHTELGTKWGDSVQIMRNTIAFVGNDNGVYVLKSFNFSSTDKLNVERIDDSIKDVIENHLKITTKVLSCMYNNQYYLYVGGTTNYIYRFYYDTGVWVRDTVVNPFASMDTINNIVNSTSIESGDVLQLKRGAFYDNINTPFSMRIQSKNFNFNEPHHRKRMKQFQLLTKIGDNTTIGVDLYADNNLLITKYLTQDDLQNSDAEKLKVTVSGRFRTTKFDLVINVQEDIQVTGFGFIFKENTPK